MKNSKESRKKVFIQSLGCARNMVDSENMAGLLSNTHEYNLTDKAEDAEVIIINTCGFIDAAKEESVNTILEAADKKSSAKCEKLLVTGCLSERYPEELINSIPEIDLVTGTAAFSKIIEEVDGLYDTKSTKISNTQERLKDYNLPRLNSQAFYTAYLKLAEGCAKRCSFCIIPKLRGKLRSRSEESLVQEAQNLAATGVRELNLIAQDLCDYGLDRKDGANLTSFLGKLVKVDKIDWIRLFYAYPDQLPESVIDLIASEQKICNYLDLPLQHINDQMLKRMNRHTRRVDIERIIESLNKKIPSLSLRTSLMVGFPGESEKDFQELCDFVSLGHIDQLGVFTYSAEEGTPSFQLPDTISLDEKLARQKEIYRIQADVQSQKLNSFVGQKIDVLIEGAHPDTPLLLKARHQGQAPEIDSSTIINKGTANVGEIKEAIVTEIAGMDLVAEIC